MGLFGSGEARKATAAARLTGRLPPGQSLTEKWPVLTYGETPVVAKDHWRLKVVGLVERELDLDWQQFLALPQTTLTADFHCVTGWSRFDNAWEGVRFVDLMQAAGLRPEARYVAMYCYGGYTTNLPLASMLDADVLVAHRHDGGDLEPAHGGPVRVVVPKRYAYKSAKWIGGLALTADDQPGFWEVRGYHNDADPWKEERYSF